MELFAEAERELREIELAKKRAAQEKLPSGAFVAVYGKRATANMKKPPRTIPGEGLLAGLSALRVKDPALLPAAIIQERLKPYTILDLGEVSLNLKPMSAVIGVLIFKGKTTETRAGKNYASWCLSDLGGSTCFLYLFESAYLEHWKTMEGSVVVVQRPRAAQRHNVVTGETGKAFLSVEKDNQLYSVGMSADYWGERGTADRKFALALQKGKPPTDLPWCVIKTSNG